MNSTSVRLGGDTSGIAFNWTTFDPAELQGGFTTQTDNPFKWGAAELLGGRYLLLGGTLIVPTPRPTGTVLVLTLPVLAAYPTESEGGVTSAAQPAPWGTVGYRTSFAIDPAPGGSSLIYWRSTGLDVAGEVIDMGGLFAVRLGPA